MGDVLQNHQVGSQVLPSLEPCRVGMTKGDEAGPEL